MSLLAADLETEIQPGFSPAPEIALEEIIAEDSSSSPDPDTPEPSAPKPSNNSANAKAAYLASPEELDHKVQGGIVQFR